jgi:hypothetical protein
MRKRLAADNGGEQPSNRQYTGSNSGVGEVVDGVII